MLEHARCYLKGLMLTEGDAGSKTVFWMKG